MISKSEAFNITCSNARQRWNRSLYESLLQRYKEVDVASGVGTNNVFIVESAELPGAPSSPKLGEASLLALVLGPGLGAVGALFIEQFDDAIYSPLDAERATGLTFWGPFQNTRRGRASRRSSRIRAPASRRRCSPLARPCISRLKTASLRR